MNETESILRKYAESNGYQFDIESRVTSSESSDIQYFHAIMAQPLNSDHNLWYEFINHFDFNREVVLEKCLKSIFVAEGVDSIEELKIMLELKAPLKNDNNFMKIQQNDKITI